MKKFFALFSLLMLACAPLVGKAQTGTMFEYPIAPDPCTSLESRCNYSTAHFWYIFDFHKPLKAENDSALITTFVDYLQIMQQANRNVAKSSIRSFMNRAQANQPNFMRIIQAAEYVLYLTPQPLVDDVYLSFLQSAVEATWMKKDAKAHYSNQYRIITNTKLGAEIKNFNVTTAEGKKMKICDVPVDSAEIVLLFFTSDGTNSQFARTRIETDLGVNELVGQGYAKVINVYVGENPKEFLAEASKYPNWTLVSTNEDKDLDIRILPSFIVLDNKHRVMNKNQDVDAIKNAFNP
ncbi:MAG: DUF5106 domain-containing protein [Bacteroidales bacterium]|nr:DUF5106 domain-containing protein [Bacteroidales bacterium]